MSPEPIRTPGVVAVDRLQAPVAREDDENDATLRPRTLD